jgi:replication initiation and membrane attachment protein
LKDDRKGIQPKSIFQAAISYPLSDREIEVLTFLYQPIIGANALSLYLTLLSEINKDCRSEELFHADLITMLDLSIPQLQAAREKLEGIGLLESFVKKDPKLGNCYLYQLLPPETAQRFFHDDVLTLVLLNRVGERKFSQLVERFRPKAIDLTGYETISASFKEVYGFKEAQIITENQRLEEVDAAFSQHFSTKKVSAASESFDWQYFLDGITRLGIQLPEDEAAFKEEVHVFHLLYGITELDMVDFASKSFDYYTSRIVKREFERTIYQAFDADKKQKTAEVIRNQEADLTLAQQQTYRYNSLKMNGFSELDIQVIMDSENNAPLQYLEALKKERGGYTTPQERSLVKYLVSKSGLPNSVINVLINYVYNIQKQPTLKAEYVNRIANEWGQSNITSPEKAIEHVRSLAKKSQEKQQQRQKYPANRQVVRQETLPDWVANPVAEKKLSKEEQAQLEQELQNLLNGEGEN